MGHYNPNAPYILGQEWAGIRDENVVFSPALNATEQGHTFTTTQAYALGSGRFYVHSLPNNIDRSAHIVAVYAEGMESYSGPVQRVVIPCNAAYVTGGTPTGTSAIFALNSPYSGTGVRLTASASLNSGLLTCGFATLDYTALAGKRILDVTVLFGGQKLYDTPAGSTGPFFYLTTVPGDPELNATTLNLGEIIPDLGPGFGAAFVGPDPLELSLGEVNYFWQGTAIPTSEILPWTYNDLLRFDPRTGLTGLYFSVRASGDASVAGDLVSIWYAALQVTYCEETRLYLGGRYHEDITSASELSLGQNSAVMRDINRVASPIMPAGSYTVTVSAAAVPDRIDGLPTGYPTLNGLRELYAIDGLDAIQTNLTTTPGQQFEAVTTQVLPQLSLHVTGNSAPILDVHAYGRLNPAQVYGGIQAIQEVDDGLAGGSYSYPQVRFYARHFNGTGGALSISGVGSAAGAMATISVAEFDDLPEIIDGWAEVTLRFGTAPTLGTLTPNPSFAWLAPTETAPTRWEVLALRAPALTGGAGSLGSYLRLVPTVQRLDDATYEPPTGGTVELTALPAYSTYASGAIVAQSDTDAVLLLSQDPPTITGFALTAQSLALSGIARNCVGDVPCCIPSAITYNRLTWSVPASGYGSFGAIELQRYDSVDGSFHTIMSASSAAVTGFNDYEARVGVDSVYRVRALNVYRFAGAWSAQVTGEVAAPGMTMSCGGDDDNRGVLIFTSNEGGAEASLAYAMQFDRSIEEGFTFPEAETRQLRRHYQRNFQRAYRPTERGGEAFTRLMMISAVAGALPNMANIRSLRDLGWDDLPYVCVRDELGNRWYANVNIPAGNVLQRSATLATVEIVEINEVPSEVDPA